MAAKLHFQFGLILFLASTIFGLPEQGVWDVTITETKLVPFTKSMYNNSLISVKIVCSPKEDGKIVRLNVRWLLRWTPCAEEYIKIQEDKILRRNYMYAPSVDQYGLNYPRTSYRMSKKQVILCDGNPSPLADETVPIKTESMKKVEEVNNSTGGQLSTKNTVEAPGGAPAQNNKAKRDVNAQNKTTTTTTATLKPRVPAKGNNKSADGTGKMQPEKHDENDPHLVANTWEDGIYLFLLEFDEVDEQIHSEFEASVSVRMKGPTGYLSAIEWPLLPFYGTMCVIYVIMALVWLVLSACNWRDLLRIQFWIGGVIFLGMLEKAVFFGEYSSVNITGKSVRGASVFAELVSCFKRTLARMLVVIVSLGFGIVKPRLGPMLHRVIGMGALYFILCSVEGCLRILRPKSDISSHVLLANIPLAVLDAAICWWVFTSLVQTTRTLRLRRNLVKLSLYRHFTNTLIFAVLASVAFMIWSIKQHKLTTCLTDWKEMWVDDAFWHLLFSIILMVIMVLWRPNINNQRYAFSPLLDAADDEAEEPMMNDAYEGMKMRTNSSSRSSSPKPKEVKNQSEDDLKWIEENIPASVTDAAIPSLLDSDEEIMTTKFEMSKME